MTTFTALADPTRRRILELLAVRDRTAGEIVAKFKVTPPAISQHLRTLRLAKLIRVRAQGQQRIHSLNPAGLDEVAAWITKTRAFWDRRLDALEATLQEEDEARGKEVGRK